MLDTRRQVVQYVKLGRTASPVVRPGLYEYRPDRGWRWLQRACFWLLGKLGAHHVETVTVFKRAVRDNDALLASLLGQQGHWLEFVSRQRHPPKIYMGPDDFVDLGRLLDHLRMEPFRLAARIEIRDGRLATWHDIPIFVVPWMKGAVLVPSDLDFAT